MTVLMGLDARLRMARLFVSTDSRQGSDDLEDFLEGVFSGGADMIAISETGLRPSRMVAALEVARSVAFHHVQGLVVVDESLDVAEQFGADVLELDATSSAAAARRVLHTWALIGRSATTPAEIDAALADPDISHVTVGPVFSTGGAPDLDLVGYAARVAPPGDVAGKPWFAFGGITLDNADEVFEAGARRLLVSRAIVKAPDPQAACERFKDKLRRLWNSDESMQAYIFGVL
ncbi:thiamine phosphate synthase [Propionicicella superfundia]|uniref:thiamine phosphate synthase n=1 Tax=Propionicicella superfundia TaxID=348582 RepID=UPI0004908E60|nr:thiamine phosphate synthase [Propionicicella superfundia]